MKHIFASLLDIAKAAVLLLIVGFGAATLSAQGTWTPAPANPPANNAAAPINVSLTAQRKFGPLFLGTSAVLSDPIISTFDVLGLASTTFLSTDNLLVSKAVTFAAGSPMKRLLFNSAGLSLIDGTQGAGKVLTSDANGIASWTATSSLGFVGAAPASQVATVGATVLGPLAYGSSNLADNSPNFVISDFTLTQDSDVVITSSANLCGGPILNVYMYVDSVQKDKKAFRGESNGADCGTVSLSTRMSLTAGSHSIKTEGGLFTSYPGYGDATRPVDTLVYVLNGSGFTAGGSSVGSCDASPYVNSMTSDTVYTNNSGTQLIVVATASESQATGQQWLQGFIGPTSASTLVSNDVFLSPNTASITFVVPPGYRYKVVNQASYATGLTSQAWKVCGGTSSGGGSVSTSSSISDVRDSLEYKTCTAGGLGIGASGVSQTCTSACSSGKKVVSGSCTSSVKPSNGNPAYAGIIELSKPNSDNTGWICTGAKSAVSEYVTANGTAVCL